MDCHTKIFIEKPRKENWKNLFTWISIWRWPRNTNFTNRSKKTMSKRTKIYASYNFRRIKHLRYNHCTVKPPCRQARLLAGVTPLTEASVYVAMRTTQYPLNGRKTTHVRVRKFSQRFCVRRVAEKVSRVRRNLLYNGWRRAGCVLHAAGCMATEAKENESIITRCIDRLSCSDSCSHFHVTSPQRTHSSAEQ